MDEEDCGTDEFTISEGFSGGARALEDEDVEHPIFQNMLVATANKTGIFPNGFCIASTFFNNSNLQHYAVSIYNQ